MEQRSAGTTIHKKSSRQSPTCLSPIPPSSVITIQRQDAPDTIEVIRPGWWAEGISISERST